MTKKRKQKPSDDPLDQVSDKDLLDVIWSDLRDKSELLNNQDRDKEPEDDHR